MEKPNPSNTAKEKTVGAIALRFSYDMHGGVYFMNIATGKRIHRLNWTEYLMTSEAIKLVESLAQNAGTMSLLSFKWSDDEIIDEQLLHENISY